MTNATQPSVPVATVRALLARQFPQWSHLPVTAGPSAGAGNALFRLGDDLLVRLPLHPGSAAAVALELTWLPRLAPRLPLAVPDPVAAGVPDETFSRPWAVFRWLPGASVDTIQDIDHRDVAGRLGQFVAALRNTDVTGAPVSLRPHPLEGDDSEVRSDIRMLGATGLLDEALATAIWEDALAALPYQQHTWIHGDLFPMNLLADRGALTAVIDFDLLGVGDSAIDMVPAWTVLTAATRPTFRAASGVDDNTWIRGRGWALKAALGAIRRYGEVSHPQAITGRYALAETLADHRQTS